MIPKKLHYCWFGKSNMPALSDECLKSWKRYLGEYEVKLWNEENCPKNDFIDYHLEMQNWAFVSDYVRLYALITEGGIYLDTDIEVLQSFDPLLQSSGFVGYQSGTSINNGVCGSEKGNEFFISCLKRMESTFNAKSKFEISPVVTTKTYASGTWNIDVYPSHFFYPYNPYDPDRPVNQLMYSMIKSDTYAIHHWEKSWDLGKLSFGQRLRRKLVKTKLKLGY